MCKLLKSPKSPAWPVITLDGPSGSGKGTIARALVDWLGWRCFESDAVEIDDCDNIATSFPDFCRVARAAGLDVQVA